jgi:AraC-like DNA-binding protein
MTNATLYSPKTRLHPLRRRGAAERRRWLARRESWLRAIAPTSSFHALFDNLPGLHFFAKNRRGQMMFLSRGIRERYGLREEGEVIGLTDFDLNPDGMAAGYTSDDERIYATGEPIIGHVEMWWDSQGIPDWYAVTKMPIRSRRRRIIGIMGVMQEYEGRAKLAAPWREILPAVGLIREKFQTPITIENLARLARLSTRQLQRKFQAVFGLTPQEFLIKTRVSAACRALCESDMSLAGVAADCGFYDQSSFTRHFRQRVGMTPKQFRQSEGRMNR